MWNETCYQGRNLSAKKDQRASKNISVSALDAADCNMYVAMLIAMVKAIATVMMTELANSRVKPEITNIQYHR